MPRFRTKPKFIEAFRLGQAGEPTPAPGWFKSPSPSRITDDGILVPTAAGVRLARWGDWIIRGVNGEVTPCKPEVFFATYEFAGPS